MAIGTTELVLEPPQGSQEALGRRAVGDDLAAFVELQSEPEVFECEDQPRGRSFGRRFGYDLLRGSLIVVFLHIFILQISVVRGHSMQPALVDGDRLVVDRVSYSFQDVARFDVVVLQNPKDPSVDYVKRVVGLPGDDVRLQGGKLLVNGEVIEESFGPISDRDSTRTFHVKKGYFFVLGDNRPVSSDSREFGLVKASLLKGKVRLRFWPLDRVALL
ncbi:MAG: signal peptidase I [Planctomycetota bacterium]|jgi:signal peptidase I